MHDSMLAAESDHEHLWSAVVRLVDLRTHVSEIKHEGCMVLSNERVPSCAQVRDIGADISLHCGESARLLLRSMIA